MRRERFSRIGERCRGEPPMPLQYDATLKDLVSRHWADFAALLRLQGPAPAHLLNVDLSTVSAATDFAVGFGEPVQWIVDLNFQAGRDADLPRRVWLYHALLHHRFRVPVHSVIILLRPEADGAELTGRLVSQAIPRRGRSEFRYEVVRLWNRPASQLLRGGPGAMPLAVLGKLPAKVPTEDALAEVVRAIDRRLVASVPPAEVVRAMTATFVLSGLRIPTDNAVRLFRGFHSMRESSTYQYILREGEVEGLRKVLLRQGRKKLGPADEQTRMTVQALDDPDRLARMFE